VQYLYVPEHGKVGHFHVHLITSATLPSRWYSDNAAETGLGYQAKAIPIEAAIECGGYVGKYLGKAMAYQKWPPYFRRVNSSRKWPRPPDVENLFAWLHLGNNKSRVAVSAIGYRRAGWKVETSIEGI